MKSFCLSSLIIISSFFGNQANAQSLFVDELGNNAYAINTGVGFGNGFAGPILAAGYSFNGKTEIALGFSSLANNGDNVTGYSLGLSLYASRQNMEENVVNVDFTPTLSTNLVEGHLQTTAAVGLGLSRNLSADPDFYFIPEVRLTYGVQIERVDTITLVSLSGNMGFSVGNNILLTISPGIAANLSQDVMTGSVTAGILFR